MKTLIVAALAVLALAPRPSPSETRAWTSWSPTASGTSPTPARRCGAGRGGPVIYEGTFRRRDR